MKMMSFRLIAFDMDGTLLDSKKCISGKVLEAMDRAAGEGRLIALSTGRSLAELVDYLPVLKQVRYLSCVSGGYVYDCFEKRFICKSVMSDDIIHRLFEVSKLEDTMIQMQTEGTILNRHKVEIMEHFQIAVYKEMFKKVGTLVDDEFDYYDREHPGVVKLNIYHTDSEARERTKARLSDLDTEQVYSEVTSLEFTNRGVSKGSGLVNLCRNIGLDPAQAICVGDGENDIPALKAAGLGIAMGNASEKVKSSAGAVVSDNDHDGCAEAILKYLL